MENGALQNALEPERGFGFPIRIGLGYDGSGRLDELGEFSAEYTQISATCTQYLGCRLVFQKSQQQVLDCHVFVPSRTCLLESRIEIELQVLAKHPGSPDLGTAPTSTTLLH
jgi:hypothetical protein